LVFVMPRRKNYFREVGKDCDAHPVDVEVERRLPQSSLSKRLRVAEEQVLRALGEHSHLYLKLEDLRSSDNAERERTYFNVGFEQGFHAGHTTASTGQTEARHRFALELTRLATLAGVPSHQALAAMLDAARAMVAEVIRSGDE